MINIGSIVAVVIYAAACFAVVWASIRVWTPIFESRHLKIAQEAMKIRELLDRLREDEGATVMFCCTNRDFNGLPDECVAVNDHWTSWADMEFRADTLVECLEAALKARDEAEGKWG